MTENILENWSKDIHGRFICSEENPMPLSLKNGGKWVHTKVRETDYDSDYSIEYKCDNCGHVWRTEMPD